MDGDAILEVTEEIRFRYLESPNCTYLLPKGLRLCRGEAWSIHGISGSGKSTLLTLLAALRRFDSGTLGFRFRDEAPRFVTPGNWREGVGPRLWRRIGFAFQRPELLRSLTVSDNLALALGGEQQTGEELFPAEEWKEIAQARVWRISGGQVQRLGLLRAFGTDQDLVLLDEPTNNLDRSNRAAVAGLVNRKRAERGLIVVSHDEEFLRLLSVDRSFTATETIIEGGVIRTLCAIAAPAAAPSAGGANPVNEETADRSGESYV